VNHRHDGEDNFSYANQITVPFRNYLYLISCVRLQMLQECVRACVRLNHHELWLRRLRSQPSYVETNEYVRSTNNHPKISMNDANIRETKFLRWERSGMTYRTLQVLYTFWTSYITGLDNNVSNTQLYSCEVNRTIYTKMYNL
jgi:hypothetical protein